MHENMFWELVVVCACVCACVCVYLCVHPASNVIKQELADLDISNINSQHTLGHRATYTFTWPGLKAGSPTARKSVVQSPAPLFHMLKCPSARYWIPNCPWWLIGDSKVWQLKTLHVNVTYRNVVPFTIYIMHYLASWSSSPWRSMGLIRSTIASQNSENVLQYFRYPSLIFFVVGECPTVCPVQPFLSHIHAYWPVWEQHLLSLVILNRKIIIHGRKDCCGLFPAERKTGISAILLVWPAQLIISWICNQYCTLQQELLWQLRQEGIWANEERDVEEEEDCGSEAAVRETATAEATCMDGQQTKMELLNITS